MMTNATTAGRTTDQLLQSQLWQFDLHLDAIKANARAVLALNPMDTDRPHTHFGVRALVSRVEVVVDALRLGFAGHEWESDLTPLLLGTYDPDDQWAAAADLVGEFGGIGDAIKAVIRADDSGMTNQHIDSIELVERLQAIALDSRTNQRIDSIALVERLQAIALDMDDELRALEAALTPI